MTAVVLGFFVRWPMTAEMKLSFSLSKQMTSLSLEAQAVRSAMYDGSWIFTEEYNRTACSIHVCICCESHLLMSVLGVLQKRYHTLLCTYPIFHARHLSSDMPWKENYSLVKPDIMISISL